MKSLRDFLVFNSDVPDISPNADISLTESIVNERKPRNEIIKLEQFTDNTAQNKINSDTKTSISEPGISIGNYMFKLTMETLK